MSGWRSRRLHHKLTEVEGDQEEREGKRKVHRRTAGQENLGQRYGHGTRIPNSPTSAAHFIDEPYPVVDAPNNASSGFGFVAPREVVDAAAGSTPKGLEGENAVEEGTASSSARVAEKVACPIFIVSFRLF